MGNSFDHNYNIFLAENAGDGSVSLYNGKLGIFNFAASGSTFAYSPGLKANLTKNAGLYTLTFDDGMVYSFGTNLKISKLADRYANALNFAYNTDKQLTTVTDTLGRVITYAYNANARLSSVTDFNGRAVNLAYYAAGDAGGSANDLKSVTIAVGASTKTISFSYTGSHNLQNLIDAKGQTYVTNTYDTNNRVLSQVYGSGTTSYIYALTGSIVATNTVTNANGTQTKYTFDANGNTTKREINDLTGTGVTVYNYVFDANARLIKTILPRGNGSTYKYDSRGNVIEKREKTDANAVDGSSDLVTNYVYDGVFDVPTSMTLPNGFQKSFVLDGTGNILQESATGIINPDATTYNTTTVYEYNPQGLLAKKTDAEGNQTTYAYGSGQVITVTHGTGSIASTESLSYDAYANILTSTNGEGKTTTFTVTPFNLTASGKTTEGIETRFIYDANNNKTRQETYTQSGGIVGVITYEYDILDRLAKKTTQVDATTSLVTVMTYDPNGNILTNKEGSGATIKYTYDAMNRATEKRIVMDPNNASLDIVTSFVYDRNGNQIRVTDPLGNQTISNFDLFDRPIKKTDPTSTYATYSYDKIGNVTEVDAYSTGNTLLQKTTSLYDGLGQKIQTTAFDLTNATPVNIVTSLKYDKNGHPKESTDAKGNKTTTTYDSLGRPSQITDALGNKTTSAYDKRNLVISKSIVPNTGTGVITTTSLYDNDGRLTQETNNLGKTKALSYNALGQVISAKDEENNITNYARNFIGKPTTETKYLSGGTTVVTGYSYDERGNLTLITDAKNNATAYQYDALNRTTKVTYPDSKILVSVYDKNSNLTSQTDPNGTVVANVYDPRNLLTTKTITTGTGVIGITSEAYSYDALGRLISGNDSNLSKLDFSYDSQGRLLSETNSGTVVGYNYDANNNLTKLIYPDLREQVYGYDALNRATNITYSGGTIATYSYSGIVNTGITYGNGKTVAQTFDGVLRLQSLNNGINSYTYSYDGV